MSCLNFPGEVPEAGLPSHPAEGSEGKPAGPLEGAEWAAETPEPRYGGGEGASPVRTAGVGELRAERVWPPGRRAGARAVAHVLRPQAGRTRPLGQAVPRRLRQASAPGPETGAHGAGAGGEGPKVGTGISICVPPSSLRPCLFSFMQFTMFVEDLT